MPVLRRKTRSADLSLFAGFEVFTSPTMKNAVFWDVAPCRSCVNRRFGGTYRLHLQDRKIRERGTSSRRWKQIYTAPHPRRRYSSYRYLFYLSSSDVTARPERYS
jgi:hypothetical protein